MIKILILTHGNFGLELLKSAEMIIGKQEYIIPLGLKPGMSPEEFLAQVTAELNKNEEYIILCDLFGGTPANISAVLASTNNLKCISGVNMPMLIEACTMRMSLEKEELFNNILQAGIDGCKNINQELNTAINSSI